MGCGKSKHDAVATGNTITRKKSNSGSKTDKDIDTVLQTGNNGDNTNSLVVQRQESNKDNSGGGGVVSHVKNIKEGKDSKKGEDKDSDTVKEGVKGGVEEHEAAAGKLISHDSPNRYFSWGKDEEAIEGVVSEGRSEKSDYESPRLDAGKESLFSDQNAKMDDNINDAVEEKVVESSEKKETKNELEPVNEKEDNVAKEAETLTISEEAKISSPTGAEKDLSGHSPSKDTKAK